MTCVDNERLPWQSRKWCSFSQPRLALITKLSISINDPQLVPLDDAILATVTHHHREYQQYAIENGAYFAPIDEVRGLSSSQLSYRLPRLWMRSWS